MADRNGYIGRAPGDNPVIIARQTYNPTGVQTNFTFDSGYTPGYLDVYLNGVKLVVATDYTATDTSIVGLTSAAQNGDILEFVAYKAFDIASVGTAEGNFTVGTDLTVTRNATIGGDATVTGDISGRNFTGVAATFTGNVTVGGILTYEDVTSVDSLGILTARTGVHVLAGGVDVDAGGLNVVGVTTLTQLTSGSAVITGVSTFSNVVVGGATTELVVTGDARVTGILTVGTASLTLNGTTGAITGGSLTNAEVAAISSEISDTAVDVFVYDTRKDSDGGAWRKRTQHTSWYNETLNTATRGSRKEFPSVAVIVAETDKVTIYDGDDPDLPMWMIINDTGDNRVLSWATGATSDDVTGLSSLNGLLCVAKSVSSVILFDFIKDDIRLTYFQSNYYLTSGRLITDRNNVATSATGGDGINIIINDANDVAMTVLPNAPIDDTTGLPVPTIAVATGGGVSVIMDNGDVFDSNDTDACGSLDFTFHDGIRLVSTRSATGSQAQRYFISQQIDTISADGWTLYDYYTGNFGGGYPQLLSEDNGAGLVSRNSNNGTVLGSNVGLTLWYVKSSDIAVNDYSTNSLLCGISTFYNTGWMHGDIKGAFLSDTDATNITGSNLIDNGDFATGDFTNWSINGTTTPTISSGGALLTTGAVDGAIWQSTSGEATSGKWVITWTVTSNSGGYFGLLINADGPNGSGSSLLQDNITASGSNYYEGNITAVEFRHRGSSSGIIDNITLRRVEDDRSVNNQGLQVYGTITKSAVATGADLVGYGGFSSSNYLERPYGGVALAPGTGQYSVSCWFKTGSTSSDQYIFDRSVDGSPRNLLLIRGSSSSPANVLQFYHVDASGNQSDLIASDFTVTDDAWHHVVALCDGSTYRVYVDGVASATTNTTIRDVDNTDTPPLYVGVRYSETSPMLGRLALLRYSLSAPSPEQIKKMYEDEKVLFQENAKATLYGSTDTVTALGYDEDTNLLHVGTSSGRSDFQGLRRINNTTTAVTTAISASNGLVAEQ